MSGSYESVALARVADALFCSDLTPEQQPGGAQVFTAIRKALTQHGDWTGRMRAVAAAFVEDLDAAAERLTWCRTMINDERARVTPHRRTCP